MHLLFDMTHMWGPPGLSVGIAPNLLDSHTSSRCLLVYRLLLLQQVLGNTGVRNRQFGLPSAALAAIDA